MTADNGLLQEARALIAQMRLETPLAAAMQVQAMGWDGQQLTLAVPLPPNVNDKGTAFAGSLASLASLTGWALLTLWAEERYGPCQVAVYHSDIFYRKPITSGFSASAALPAADALVVAEQALLEHGRAKLALAISLAGSEGEAVTMKAKYAVWLLDDEHEPQ